MVRNNFFVGKLSLNSVLASLKQNTQPFKKDTTSVPKLVSPEALATQKLAEAYDVSKIPNKLDHFGLTEPNVQLMLHHQLVQQDIPVEPNPKV